MKSCQVTDEVITLDVTWEDILWQMLSCCGLTVFWTYKIVKVIKLSKKLPQRILGGVFFYDNYNSLLQLLYIFLLRYLE